MSAKKFTESLEQLIDADKRVRADAAKVFGIIADDLAAKGREFSDQQKRVSDAINNGTRITKRRIPL